MNHIVNQEAVVFSALGNRLYSSIERRFKGTGNCIIQRRYIMRVKYMPESVQASVCVDIALCTHFLPVGFGCFSKMQRKRSMVGFGSHEVWGCFVKILVTVKAFLGYETLL